MAVGPSESRAYGDFNPFFPLICPKCGHKGAVVKGHASYLREEVTGSWICLNMACRHVYEYDGDLPAQNAVSLKGGNP